MSDEYEDRKNASDEDWAVTPVNVPPAQNAALAPEAADETEVITLVPSRAAAKKEKSDGWKMPEPVFRVSSGKSFKKSEEAESKKAPPPKDDLPFSQPIRLEKVSAANEIAKPQPNISAEFTIKESAPKTVAKTQTKSWNPILVVLAFLAMVAFAVVFLIVVGYLFFYKTDA